MIIVRMTFPGSVPDVSDDVPGSIPDVSETGDVPGSVPDASEADDAIIISSDEENEDDEHLITSINLTITKTETIRNGEVIKVNRSAAIGFSQNLTERDVTDNLGDIFDDIQSEFRTTPDITMIKK